MSLHIHLLPHVLPTPEVYPELARSFALYCSLREADARKRKRLREQLVIRIAKVGESESERKLCRVPLKILYLYLYDHPP
jgi:hypothetical protein